MSYTGDVTVEETWEILTQNDKAVLIDVRTEVEWAFVGTCDLSEIDKAPLFVSWQLFPHMEINPAFTDLIMVEDIPKDSLLYFLCRSGIRSKSAAAAITQAGYENCFNILGGFEGDRDHSGHRGQTGGWKAAGLPWIQN